MYPPWQQRQNYQQTNNSRFRSIRAASSSLDYYGPAAWQNISSHRHPPHQQFSNQQESNRYNERHVNHHNERRAGSRFGAASFTTNLYGPSAFRNGPFHPPPPHRQFPNQRHANHHNERRDDSSSLRQNRPADVPNTYDSRSHSTRAASFTPSWYRPATFQTTSFHPPPSHRPFSHYQTNNRYNVICTLVQQWRCRYGSQCWYLHGYCPAALSYYGPAAGEDFSSDHAASVQNEPFQIGETTLDDKDAMYNREAKRVKTDPMEDLVSFNYCLFF